MTVSLNCSELTKLNDNSKYAFLTRDVWGVNSDRFFFSLFLSDISFIHILRKHKINQNKSVTLGAPYSFGVEKRMLELEKP